MKTITTLAMIAALLFGARNTRAFCSALLPPDSSVSVEGAQIEAVRLDDTPSVEDTLHLEAYTPMGFYGCFESCWYPRITVDDTILVKIEQVTGTDTLRTWYKQRYGAIDDFGRMPLVFLGEENHSLIVNKVTGSEKDTIDAVLIDYRTNDTITDKAITAGYNPRALYGNLAANAAGFTRWMHGDSIGIFFDDGEGFKGSTGGRIDTTKGHYTYFPDVDLASIHEHKKPEQTTLSAYPNPFNSKLSISSLNPVNIYDINGKHITQVTNIWDAFGYPTGLYILEDPKTGEITRAMLIK